MMNYEQINTILSGAKEMLNLLYEQPDYQQVEECSSFNTVDDVRLIDAIEILHRLSDGVSVLSEQLGGEIPRHSPDIALGLLQSADLSAPPAEDDDEIPF